MALEVKGKLLQKLDVVSGESAKGKWEKQEFIIETDDQFPKKVCMNVWGDKLSMLEKVAVGDSVIVSVNLESREFHGRWYTDIKAWRIERSADEGSMPMRPQDEPPLDLGAPSDDLPF